MAHSHDHPQLARQLVNQLIYLSEQKSRVRKLFRVYDLSLRIEFTKLPQRELHSRNKKALEFIAKGWNSLKEVDRVIDYCELNDKRLIPLLRTAKENFELALEADNTNTHARGAALLVEAAEMGDPDAQVIIWGVIAAVRHWKFVFLSPVTKSRLELSLPLSGVLLPLFAAVRHHRNPPIDTGLRSEDSPRAATCHSRSSSLSARVHHAPPSRPPFSATSPPCCSSASFLPSPTFKILVGSIVVGRSELPCYCSLKEKILQCLELFEDENGHLPVRFLKDLLSIFREPQLSQQRNSIGKITELGQIQLRSFKTCYSFWTNARDVFANDVQRLFDSTQQLVSLQQTNLDTVSHIAKARVAVEELKGLLMCNSVEETTKQIDKLLMPLVVEEEVVVVLEECHEMVKVVAEFRRLKSNNHAHSVASPSVSTACISHSMGSQGPWIIDSGASDHISINDSVFSSISSPKFPHFISLANGSKMDWNTGQLIDEGHELRGLYYLSNNPSTLCFASVSPKLLHNRLGHPSLAKLKLMVVINFLQEQSNVCFLDILVFKKGTNVTLHPQKDTICRLMFTFFEETMFFSTKDDFDSIQQALPILYLSSTESSSFETHNQDILQPSSSIHSQAILSSPSMSTCQSRTQEMGTPLCEDPLDSCPLSSANPTLDPPSSSPSHDSNISWPIALRKVGPNGIVDLLKARLVAKGYTQDDPYSDPERCRRLVGKLIYLTITRPDISFAMGVVSQFMHAPCVDHWEAILRILIYSKKTLGQGLLYEDKGDTHISGSPIDRQSTTGFCISIGENVVSWKSKKQNTVARSSTEVEYGAMALATCELIWVKQLIQELKFGDVQPMKLYCDNQAALHTTSNLNDYVQTDQQAFYYLEKAVDQLHPGALYLLGAVYLTGDCIKKDIASALWCFHRASEKAFSWSQPSQLNLIMAQITCYSTVMLMGFETPFCSCSNVFWGFLWAIKTRLQVGYQSSSRELMVSSWMEAKLESLERRMEEMGHELIESFTHRQGGENDGEDEGCNQEEGNKGKFVEKREERMRRLEVPYFTCEDPYRWIYRVERYFDINNIHEEEKVLAKENPYEVLMGLRQTHSIEKYKEMFELISTPLRHAEEEVLKGVFMNDLKKEVRVEVDDEACTESRRVECVVDKREWWVEWEGGASHKQTRVK
ncbi:putative mitochondrial protein, partial [Mucuna pruriens]